MRAPSATRWLSQDPNANLRHGHRKRSVEFDLPIAQFHFSAGQLKEVSPIGRISIYRYILEAEGTIIPLSPYDV